MSLILYLETNFVIGAALGRDKKAEALLQLSSADLQITLPSVSVMEAWSVFEDERKRRNVFRQTLDQQISQLRRDETSPHAKALLQYLQLAYTENTELLNDIENRLRDILSKLSGLQPGFSAANLLPLTQKTFQNSLPAGPTKDPTDNLILAIILAHASEYPTDEKVFLSGNIRDFQTPEIEALLSAAGITRYFARTGQLPPPEGWGLVPHPKAEASWRNNRRTDVTSKPVIFDTRVQTGQALLDHLLSQKAKTDTTQHFTQANRIELPATCYVDL